MTSATPVTGPGLPGDVILLDVRRLDEWTDGHAPGAVHIPLDELPGRLAEVPSDQPIYAVCHAGGRSARATAFLRQQGRDVTNYEGGMLAWAAAGGPLVAENGATPTVG